MASSNKRERDLARARYEAQARRRAQQVSARRRRQQLIGGVVALVLVLAGVGWLVLTNRQSPAEQPAASPVDTAAPTSGCTEPVTPTAKTASWKTAPKDTLRADTAYRIDLDTNCGTIVIESTPELVKAAPKTVSSQVFLAEHGFFDASDCFRLTTSGLYVLQCGSPANDGTGGPGYEVPDENLPKKSEGNYPAGTVAMANSGPNTNGSQFFLVYKDTTLGPDYTIWGKIVSGLDVLTKVADQGVQGGGADGKPVQPLVITKATVSPATGSSG